MSQNWICSHGGHSKKKSETAEVLLVAHFASQWSSS